MTLRRSYASSYSHTERPARPCRSFIAAAAFAKTDEVIIACPSPLGSRGVGTNLKLEADDALAQAVRAGVADHHAQRIADINQQLGALGYEPGEEAEAA